MTKKDIQVDLFDDFYICTKEALEAFEAQFRVSGLREQVLGADSDDEASRTHLRQSPAWATLERLHAYAVNGVTADFEPMSLVLDGGSVIRLVSTEMHWPSKEWDEILAMADGRYALDEGSPIQMEKIALLANVDVRTVRNAISAGDLVAVKKETMTFVENASARRWLHGRRGFKPTVYDQSEENQTLDRVNTAADFGALLRSQRERIGLGDSERKVTILHPLSRPDTLKELESGVFNLPLDAVLPIADFYQLSRKALLDCVMRVFFQRELDLLTDASNNVVVTK